MSEPYIGEIRMFAGNFPPRNYSFCNGQIIAVSQFEALFSLVGTNYGGDGRSSFGLPDMRGRVPIHYGQGPGLTPRPIGQTLGREDVTLVEDNIPSHNHSFNASRSSATSADCQTYVFASIEGTSDFLYKADNNRTQVQLKEDIIGEAGGNKPYDIRMPYLAISFIIAMNGIYPSRN